MIRERVRLGILLSPEGLANPLGVWKISSLTNIVKKKKKRLKWNKSCMFAHKLKMISVCGQGL